MKILLSKNFVSRVTSLRIFATLTFIFGVFGVWILQPERVTNSFPVYLSPEPFALPCGQKRQSATEDLNDRNAIITDANLTGIDMRGANLSFANITNADFSDANLNRADFSDAKVFYSNFSNSDLGDASFIGATFRNSDFTDANLINAKMTRAALYFSDFRNAELDGADLTDANLSNARLETARGLTYEQIGKAVINKFTTLPPHLEAKRRKLWQKSLKNLKRLHEEMSEEDFEAYLGPNTFLEKEIPRAG